MAGLERRENGGCLIRRTPDGAYVTDPVTALSPVVDLAGPEIGFRAERYALLGDGVSCKPQVNKVSLSPVPGNQKVHPAA
ncbi:hypothetical protein PAAG_01967 [Paracoccidioides lutzii Pb01]|uniref:Uncharacterized protein n=1 Tax=Paracoccidioides lutzii (strain ATCC MYA-826 / Pb01) TaxID=502779 RepID=C1GTX2_PARBA|nr:hypothetical protein PAAG_01967 [Paracoccidioides lutzii Pb01]EEH39778.2 hypothetical protein PAAG_01967 [Paracoccidioides lutzii Pb01]